MDTNLGTSTTYFVGAHYEVTDGVITKYYYAGAQRIAMRTNGILSFILGDHLGSTSLVTDATGVLVSETRYKAWGEVRYSSATSPTDYTYTGQFSYTANFGLMYYGARWYDSSLGRFAQADSIIPGGVQGYDRYAYTANNPVRYVDPSGHTMYCTGPGGNYCYDDTPAPSSSGCSVSTGGFNGSFTCTPADLNGATIAQRKDWFNSMLSSVDPTLPEQFTNINGILKAFIATGEGAPDSWTSWGDAGILNSIQNGLALSKGKLGSIDATNPYAVNSANAWNEYFQSYKSQRASNHTLQLWGAAEGLGTSYGRLLAGEHGATKSSGEMLFLAVGNWYRSELKTRQDPATLTTQQWSKDFYGWLFDTSSTVGVPYTDIDTGIAPVSLVADMLLRIK